jgi:hypothetical protein
MYTFAVYGLLLVWRLYDWWRLIEEDTTSLVLFIKWSLIDIFFMFGVPLLRIPWLEWSETTSFAACFVHTVINGMLMFRVPVSDQIKFLGVYTNVFEDSNRGLDFNGRKDCIRQGGEYFRWQSQTSEYLAQLFSYHGKANYQYPS